MKFKRWVCLLLLLAVPLPALACGDDGGDSIPPVVTDEELTTAEELLASMALTAEEVGGVFPGIAWAVGESHPTFGLGGVIPDDQRAVGLVAAWQAVVFEPEEEQVVSTDLYLYDTVEAAGGALGNEKLPQVELEAAQVGSFDVEQASGARDVPVRLVQRLKDAIALGGIADLVKS